MNIQRLPIMLLTALFTAFAFSLNAYAELRTNTAHEARDNHYAMESVSLGEVRASKDDLGEGYIVPDCGDSICPVDKAYYDATTVVESPNGQTHKPRVLLNKIDAMADIIVLKFDSHISYIGLYP